MPIYEYQCNKCGCVFEELVMSSDCGDEYFCPTCGDEDTCRLMSSFSCGSASGVGDLPSSCGPSSSGFS
ncbi:MAG: zinc ribbon domain-containing protein [Desulfobacteraceae bacterium]|nr:zinc ribbon domain-containing protein [Desulfobacteraceae bacterium]